MNHSLKSRLRGTVFAALTLAAVAATPVALAATPDQSGDQSVTIDNFAFAPAGLSVPVGATLTWTNVQDGVRHTTSSLDGTWDSGVLSSGDSFAFTFTTVGDFAYQCNIHPSMKGVVHVIDNSAAPAPTQTIAPAAASAPTDVAPAVPASAPTAVAPAAPTPAATVVVPSPRPTPTPAPSTYYGY